ncbi:MAG: hypothetical protein K2G86_03465 [Prevotella sp.]|nr:hypothetical protein [Prevotella sp.]MDE6355302.1 hypothetical protein [Prevotella sp.]
MHIRNEPFSYRYMRQPIHHHCGAISLRQDVAPQYPVNHPSATCIPDSPVCIPTRS